MQQQPIIEELEEYLLQRSKTIVYGLRLSRINRNLYIFCRPVIERARNLAAAECPQLQYCRYETKRTQYWCNENGLTHRDWDLPAKISGEGNLYWYRYGVIHRGDDKPAVIKNYGKHKYYQRGSIHRDNGYPAVINYIDKVCEYWINGKMTMSFSTVNSKTK